MPAVMIGRICGMRSPSPYGVAEVGVSSTLAIFNRIGTSLHQGPHVGRLDSNQHPLALCHLSYAPGGMAINPSPPPAPIPVGPRIGGAIGSGIPVRSEPESHTGMESNHRLRFWRPPSYHWTTGIYGARPSWATHHRPMRPPTITTYSHAP